jgi:hypothetical protein
MHGTQLAANIARSVQFCLPAANLQAAQKIVSIRQPIQLPSAVCNRKEPAGNTTPLSAAEIQWLPSSNQIEPWINDRTPRRQPRLS